MALAFIEHWNDRQAVIDDVFAAARDAEANRQREYDAAVLIQAVIRGVRLRQFIGYLHMCAGRVQMAWRGYLGRKQYHRELAIRVQERQLHYYHRMATKIKKVWKGHYVRKHVYDYYAMKTYLLALQEKNAIVREKLAYYERDIKERKEVEEQLEELNKHNNFARSCHYMLSTQVKPGVFNKLGEPTEFESHVANVFPRDLSRKKNSWHKKPSSPPQELPPLKKVQGPFKSPGKVYLQRHKALKPSLKVQTSFISEETAKEKEKQEEWCKRVIDDEFSPFQRMTYEYIPSLHNSTKCESIAYGTKTFREVEVPDKMISSDPFKTVFNRIPEFDQLGESYS